MQHPSSWVVCDDMEDHVRRLVDGDCVSPHRIVIVKSTIMIKISLRTFRRYAEFENIEGGGGGVPLCLVGTVREITISGASKTNNSEFVSMQMPGMISCIAVVHNDLYGARSADKILIGVRREYAIGCGSVQEGSGAGSVGRVVDDGHVEVVAVLCKVHSQLNGLYDIRWRRLDQ